jgi:hypothetical protein
MIRRLIIIISAGTLLSGCFMAPMALLGPVTSGFSTASIMQSGVTTGFNYAIKKSTGKTVGEHVLDSIVEDVLVQAYFPKISYSLKVAP